MEFNVKITDWHTDKNQSTQEDNRGSGTHLMKEDRQVFDGSSVRSLHGVVARETKFAKTARCVRERPDRSDAWSRTCTNLSNGTNKEVGRLYKGR